MNVLEQALEALKRCTKFEQRDYDAMEALEEAIKNQGKPVATVEEKRIVEHVNLPVGTDLFISAPTTSEDENQAVRMFLMYYGAHSGVTIEGMRENLRISGHEGCWPDWAATETGHLTKAGAQDWIKHILLSAKGEPE